MGARTESGGVRDGDEEGNSEKLQLEHGDCGRGFN